MLFCSLRSMCAFFVCAYFALNTHAHRTKNLITATLTRTRAHTPVAVWCCCPNRTGTTGTCASEADAVTAGRFFINVTHGQRADLQRARQHDSEHRPEMVMSHGAGDRAIRAQHFERDSGDDVRVSKRPSGSFATRKLRARRREVSAAALSNSVGQRQAAQPEQPASCGGLIASEIHCLLMPRSTLH